MNILKYREYIDTECSNHDNKILNRKALKLDGCNSLKMSIGCKDLKSCDYLKYKKEEILLIEISDIKKQFDSIMIRKDSLTVESKKQLGKKLNKKIDPRNIIRDELRAKYLETSLILKQLTENVKFNINKSKIFIIAICSKNISDIMAFQYLINDLKSSLKAFLKDVQIILAKDIGMVI